jgi:hypothetical protein
VNKTLIAIGVLALSFSAMAVTPAQTTKQFCADRKSKNYIKELALEEDSRMGFQNQGGLVNGGTCWWHSRFQRNALYLTIYSPNKPVPTQKEARAIIDAIRAGKTVVEIPGYSNFNEFSYSHYADILRELEKWQKGDGFARGQWIRGLAGKSTVSADKMREMMDELYQYVEVKGNIAYQKLQLKGIVAHAWLVVSMKKTTNGYVLSVIDSNNPSQTESYTYSNGDTNFSYQGYGEFTPYLEREKELENVQKTIRKTCG